MVLDLVQALAGPRVPEQRIGTMVGCGERALTLYGHPRLLDLSSGTVIAEWPDIDAGEKAHAYGVTHVPTPVTALHPDLTRFAIVQPQAIAVIDLPPP